MDRWLIRKASRYFDLLFESIGKQILLWCFTAKRQNITIEKILLIFQSVDSKDQSKFQIAEVVYF